MIQKFNKRVYNLKTQNADIKKFLTYSKIFVEALLNPVIDKSFAESISLAVAEVNGCELCSYVHAKNALKAGMSQEDVDFLTSGSFENVPKEQLKALLFAQHYAETKGNPDPLTYQKVLDTYGKEKVEDIMSHIRMMMITNLHGNTMEALKLRIKGRGIDNSSFWQELGVSINFFKIIPPLIRRMIQFKLSRKRIRID